MSIAARAGELAQQVDLHAHKGVVLTSADRHVGRMHPDRRLDEFAARQYGVFSLRQARSVGLTVAMMETRRKSGAWISMAPSVYALASAPPKWERQMAAALLTHPGSLVAGRSAAYLHGFPGFRAGRPVILIGASGNGRSELATVIRSSYFEKLERVRIRGFEATGEADTILTLARDHSAIDLERIVDEVLVRATCSVEDLDRAVSRQPRAAGRSRLRSVLDERRPDAYQPPTSELERLLYRLVNDPRIPPSTRQLPFRFQSIGATVDLYIAAWRLIVEGDGRRWHTRQADMERDRIRDNEATAHGYAVLRFTWRMLTRSPGQCLDQLLRTGEVRSAG